MPIRIFSGGEHTDTSTGISVVSYLLLSMEPHTRLRGHPQFALFLYEDAQRAFRDAGGVLARLCSHLREMTGLTIRATVPPEQSAVFICCHHGWSALYRLPTTAARAR
jgi:hypothetical protein